MKKPLKGRWIRIRQCGSAEARGRANACAAAAVARVPWTAALVIAAAALIGCGDTSRTEHDVPATADGSAGHLESSSPLATRAAETLPQLADVTAAWDLEHRNRTGSEQDVFSILEVTGGGLAVLDFDLDARPDLFTLGGGSFDASQERVLGAACQLHWNRGGRMQRIGPQAGAGIDDFYSLGAARADVNEDGFDDLVVTGYGGVALLINQGDGTFHKDLLPTPPDTFAVAAAVADLDGDASLDIYVTNYCDWSFKNNPKCVRGSASRVREICSPNSFLGRTDLIFSRDATGQWVAVDGNEKMPPVDQFQTHAMSVLVAEMTGDEMLDLYVANDTDPNQLFVQQPGGGYIEQGIARGVAVGGDAQPNGSMGIAFGDIDADAHADLVVTNFVLEPIAVYLGRGRGIFQFGSRQIGVNNAGKSYVSWGASLVDLDTDGDLDLVIVNGDIYRDRTENRQPGLVFVNIDGKLVEQTDAVAPSLSQPSESRGLANLDFDLDGRCDFAVGRLDDSPHLLRNTTPTAAGIWLNLIGIDSPREPVGATVTVHSSRPWVYKWTHGGSYASSHQRGIFLPAAGASRLEITVRWPSGFVQDATIDPARRAALVSEGREPIYPLSWTPRNL